MRTTPSSAAGVACSLAAAGLLAVLVVLSVVSGVSQQTFELFAPPEGYAAALVAAAEPLRRTLFVDDLFVTAYVSATLFFLDWLAQRRASRVLPVVLGFGVTAGLLDLAENHHILTMLRAAESGLAPSAAEISAQMVASSLKWVLGHVAFAMVGLVIEARGPLARFFRLALVVVQLPIGVLVFTASDPRALAWLGWARYANVFSGFLVIAYLMSRNEGEPASAPDAVAGGSGEPA
jgi:hypothetical protein